MKKIILAFLAILVLTMPLAFALPAANVALLQKSLNANTCKGDLFKDGKITSIDVDILTEKFFGKTKDSMRPRMWSRYGRYADMNDDEKIDLTDLGEILGKFGKKCKGRRLLSHDNMDTCKGDLFKDGKITSIDVDILSEELFGKTKANMRPRMWSSYGYYADMNDDEKIDLTDLGEILGKFGEKC